MVFFKISVQDENACKLITLSPLRKDIKEKLMEKRLVRLVIHVYVNES